VVFIFIGLAYGLHHFLCVAYRKPCMNSQPLLFSPSAAPVGVNANVSLRPSKNKTSTRDVARDENFHSLLKTQQREANNHPFSSVQKIRTRSEQQDQSQKSERAPQTALNERISSKPDVPPAKKSVVHNASKRQEDASDPRTQPSSSLSYEVSQGRDNLENGKTDDSAGGIANGDEGVEKQDLKEHDAQEKEASASLPLNTAQAPSPVMIKQPEDAIASQIGLPNTNTQNAPATPSSLEDVPSELALTQAAHIGNTSANAIKEVLLPSQNNQNIAFNTQEAGSLEETFAHLLAQKTDAKESSALKTREDDSAEKKGSANIVPQESVSTSESLNALLSQLKSAQATHSMEASNPDNVTALGQEVSVSPLSGVSASTPQTTSPLHKHADIPETSATLSQFPIEIGFKALSGAKRFDIRLDPAELGRVEVRLEMSDAGEVSAKLTVDRVETLHLLQRDARTLERAFEQIGLKAGDGSVTLTLRDPDTESRREDARQNTAQETPENSSPRNDPRENSTLSSDVLPMKRYSWRSSTGVDMHV
jgi:flagellar hook-length control protein FliK